MTERRGRVLVMTTTFLSDPLPVLAKAVIQQALTGSPKAVAIRLGTVAYSAVKKALRDHYGPPYAFMGLQVIEDASVTPEGCILDLDSRPSDSGSYAESCNTTYASLYMDARRDQEAALRERDEARSENIALRLGKFAGMGDEEILAEAQRRFPLLGYAPPLPDTASPPGLACDRCGTRKEVTSHGYLMPRKRLCPECGRSFLMGKPAGRLARALASVGLVPAAVLSAAALAAAAAMLPGLWAAFR